MGAVGVSGTSKATRKRLFSDHNGVRKRVLQQQYAILGASYVVESAQIRTFYKREIQAS